MSLRNKVVLAASWNFIGRMVNISFTFIIGIIIARLLSPAEYGLVGIANIFIVLTSVFIDAGFGYALIQKKGCDNKDYSTIFFFNLIVSIFFYFLFFILSRRIAEFFHEEILINILRVLSLAIIIESLYLVQVVQLKKLMKFKTMAKAQIIANILAGFISILLAYKGYGVWSLVFKSIISQLLLLFIYYFSCKWIPQFIFSFTSIKKLFVFGSYHLISGVIYVIYNNLRSTVIAKYYSPIEFGLYSRAESFQNISSVQISGTISEITFPLFSELQDNKNKLKQTLRSTIKMLMYFNISISFCMLILANVMIIGLIGNQWSGAVKYLQLLCIYGAIYPIAPILLNAINALGRSDLFLKLEIIRKVLDIPVLIIGAVVGIQEMIIGIIIATTISLIIIMKIINKLIGYNLLNLVTDLKRPLFMGFIICPIIIISLFILKNYFNNLSTFIICTVFGLICFFVINITIKSEEYLLIKGLLMNKFKSIKI